MYIGRKDRRKSSLLYTKLSLSLRNHREVKRGRKESANPVGPEKQLKPPRIAPVLDESR